MSQSSIYAGQQLSDREIRLLFIEPSRDPQQQLKCTCRPYVIETTPPYEALSYVWGAANPKTNQSFICNGVEVWIGANLANALWRLRLPHSERVLWVDALCINQCDNDEKSLQVPMMSSIFSLATRVVVWLGLGDPQLNKQTAQCVRLIGQICRRYVPIPNEFGACRGICVEDNVFGPSVCKGLQDLYNQPYFVRVWCIQEIRLAKDAVVLWGNEEITWSDVGMTAWWIQDNKAAVPFVNGVNSWHAQQMYSPVTERKPLLQILDSYRKWHATDPRDKVYGLLSLVSSNEEVKAVNLDYKKGVHEVYADTVLSVVGMSLRLTALTLVAHPPIYCESDGFRSWAPRWDRKSWSSLPMYSDNLRDHLSACKGQSARTIDSDHISCKHLLLRGLHYDTVTTVHNVMTLENLQAPAIPYAIHPFLEIYKKVIIDTPSISGQGTTDWQKLARIMTAGWFDHVRQVRECNVSEQAVYYHGFTAMLQGLMDKHIHHTDSSDSAAPTAPPNRYQNIAYAYCDYRRTFRLQNGTYGLGPQCMRPGDIVVVLYGGDFPFVLRLKGDQYQFMGTAYVDEIMCGQLVAEVEAGKRQELEFRLV